MSGANHAEAAAQARAKRRRNFTDRTILALKPTAKLTDYWDSSLPGFGIRVAPSGFKTWIVMYRRPSGNASRMKLGTYPAVKLAEARLAAQRMIGGIQIDHRDPVAEREAERNAETFAQLADEYMRRWAKQVGADGRPRKRSWREDERQINLYLLPAWRNRKVKDIVRRDVRDLVEGIAERRLRKGITEDGTLKSLARVKRRLRTVVLYARRADHRNVVHWARIAERTLPEHTEFCFSAAEVARALKLRPRNGTVTRHSATGHTIDVEVLRRALGLTQAQLATAIGVAERTVQNWEAGRVSSKMERRLRDLVELNEALERYLPPDQRQTWLISPNDAFAGDAPRDWIVVGRARDLLWEFRRVQVGEPV